MIKENNTEIEKNNDSNSTQENNDNISFLKKENEDSKNKINELEKKIKKLEIIREKSIALGKENEEYKTKNNKLENRIEELEIIAEKNIVINKENEEYKKRINQLENRIKELEIIVKEKIKILDKEKENSNILNNKIIELKNKQKDLAENNKKLELEINYYRKYFNLSPEVQLISIKFVSTDQQINHEVIAKNTEVFSKIETDLYNLYGQYKYTENIFLMNGRKINRHLTLIDNQIKNNDILTLCIID